MMSVQREKTTKKKTVPFAKKENTKIISQKSKPLKSSKSDNGFMLDMSEWEEVSTRSRINPYDMIDEVCVSFSSKPNKFSGQTVYVMQIVLVPHLYDFLDVGEDRRCHILKNKNQQNRIILTRSPNGYAISAPKSSRNKYLKLTLSDMIPAKLHTMIKCKTIKHEKRGNSGSIIEFFLPDDAIRSV